MKVLDAEQVAPQAGALFEQVGDEPVLIRRGEQELAVLLSPAKYRTLRRGELEDFDTFCERLSANVQARGLTEEKLQAILTEIQEEDRA